MSGVPTRRQIAFGEQALNGSVSYIFLSGLRLMPIDEVSKADQSFAEEVNI
jgi:hypothetical protein